MKKIIVGFMAIMLVASLAVAPGVKAGGLFDNNDNDLGDLFLLDRLFGGDDNGVFGNNDNDLGDLFVLDRLFGDSGSIFGDNGSDLGSLFILDRLFSDGENGILNSGDNNLGNLFILDRLFSDSSESILGGNGSDLGNLFILDRLFSNGESGIIDGDDTDLGDLFLLDRLFSQDDEEAVSDEEPAESVAQPTMAEQLSGRILLQVEDEGQAWYVNPTTLRRHFLNGPNTAFNVMSDSAVGITNADFNEINGEAPNRYAGQFLLKTEDDGELYYVNPTNLSVRYISSPADAFSLIQDVGLGVSNADLDRIIVEN